MKAFQKAGEGGDGVKGGSARNFLETGIRQDLGGWLPAETYVRGLLTAPRQIPVRR